MTDGTPTLTDWHPHALTRNHSDNGWACDGRSRSGGCRRGITGFNQTRGVPRYRCSPCDYDLCDMCFSAATQPKAPPEPEKKVPESEPEPEGPFIPTYLNELVGLLVNSERMSDVRFIVGEKKFNAHRLILAAHSALFQEMLYKRGEGGTFDVSVDKTPVEVKLNDVDPDAFEAFLKCIYSDKVEVNSSNIQGLMKLGTKYQVEKVKTVCADFMEGDINKDNVLDLFQIAPALLGDQEFGLKFIEENAEEVLKSDGFTKLSKDRLEVILKDDKLAIDEIEVFKALQSWAEAEAKRTKGETKTIVKDLIKLIRFPTMELNSIATVVGPSGLLDQSALVGLFSYVSVPDESIRSKLPDPGFPTTPREGSQVAWTWDNKKKGSSVTLSNNNLSATTSGYSWNNGLVLGTREFKEGNHYWEIKIDHSTDDMVGVASPYISCGGSSAYSNQGTLCWFVHHSSGTYGGSVGIKSSLNAGLTTGHTVGIALTFDKSKKTFDMTVYKNRVVVGTPFRNIPSPVVAATELYSTPARVTLNTKVKKP